jgi:prepilin-type N-terminal cleavage/methylation domain-containing protein
MRSGTKATLQGAPARVRSPGPAPGPGTRGVTLIELLVALAMLVVLAAVAMPVFTGTIAQRRLASAADRVLSDLREVQSRAIMQGTLQRLWSGNDPLAGQPGRYRLEERVGAAWIPRTQWFALASDYQGASLGAFRDGASVELYQVIYNAQGAVQAAGVTFPIRIAVTTPVGTRTIQILRSGNASIQ